MYILFEDLRNIEEVFFPYRVKVGKRALDENGGGILTMYLNILDRFVSGHKKKNTNDITKIHMSRIYVNVCKGII